MPKKRKLTPESKLEIERCLASMRLGAWQICKDLKLHYNDGDDIRNKAAAISILVSEFEDQLKEHLEETMKWQDD